VIRSHGPPPSPATIDRIMFAHVCDSPGHR
jgi:hypothetical protein